MPGEDVMEVPRPATWPAGAKWNKFCRVSQDWRTLGIEELLDKGDTAYNDFVSCHIKARGNMHARTTIATTCMHTYVYNIIYVDQRAGISGCFSSPSAILLSRNLNLRERMLSRQRGQRLMEVDHASRDGFHGSS